jgi:hypothetical protein
MVVRVFISVFVLYKSSLSNFSRFSEAEETADGTKWGLIDGFS